MMSTLQKKKKIYHDGTILHRKKKKRLKACWLPWVHIKSGNELSMGLVNESVIIFLSVVDLFIPTCKHLKHNLKINGEASVPYVGYCTSWHMGQVTAVII